MNDPEASEPVKPKGKLASIIFLFVVLALGGAGFALTYLDLLPIPTFESKEESTDSVVEFVEVPQVQVPLLGTRGRIVSLSASIETTSEFRSEVEYLMPRVQDIIISFLSGVDVDAYDKRGALEIIRAELFSRTRMVLGEDHAKDLLIREFLIK